MRDVYVHKTNNLDDDDDDDADDDKSGTSLESLTC